jgi:amino acid permease
MSLGVGVFVQPKTVASMGWALGSALIVFFAITTNYSQFLVLKVLEECINYRVSVPNLSSLTNHVLGRLGLTVGACATVVTCLIANAAHLSTVSSMQHGITHGTSLANTKILGSLAVNGQWFNFSFDV